MRRKERIFFTFWLILLLLFIHNGETFGQPDLKILLANDDGIDSPGIAALFEKLSQIALVTVAAPSKNYSSVGHGITSNDPIMVEETEKKGTKWYSIGALPATCVRLALESLVDEKPDIVVSGINKGENVGVVTYYSGTVACAREAAFKGIPSVAISLEEGKVMDYAAAADFMVGLIQEMKEKKLKPGIYLNVNFPSLPKYKIKGILITKQDTRPSLEYFEQRKNPRGKIYFWNFYKPLDQGSEKTDVWALRNGYISITPFSFDQTSFSEIESLASWKIIKWKK
jgi:5'-nucleotidase